MRHYLDIDLATRTVTSRELKGREFAEAGRYFIAKTLLKDGVATVDPMSPENPLIFSAGPFAGTNFSNANRLSIGCKSPLTGGIKESNAGGTFALAMGHLQIAGFTLHGAADDWVVIHIDKDGNFSWDTAEPYMGKGNIEAAALLHEKYGRKTSVALCSPVGEYCGLLAGIAVSDAENRPVRIAARGGVGAVMGLKKVKAIVVDKTKMPPLHDRPKVMGAIKQYGAMLREQPAVQNMSTYGTAMMADYTNATGALPVRNFSAGQIVDPKEETFEAGGDFIYNQNVERGGDPSHACMPGCLIKCSNIYNDEEGNEVVSPLEYETIGLLGTNCGIKDPDDIARLNFIANDLGIDTIEVGAMLAILMDHGEAEYGDVAFMERALEDIRVGNERGRILAQGTARVGAHYGIERVPVIKKQAISAYDPRVIEVTGVSMMLTAQGADHTAGNLPHYDSVGKPMKDLAERSYQVQINSAVADSLGLCVFGRTVTDVNRKLIADAINDSYNIDIPPDFIDEIGIETLRLEKEFNRQAGFTVEDDELPEFFLHEPLAPTNKKGRLHAAEVNAAMDKVVAAW
ncbi:MAG: aldehyde ferredoxin oxidoreductase [Rhodospirillaceae bacterium]|nr:aldehyde ferredoxin oxidoreductase [Rhodospirillaceae bacterium]